MAEITSSLLNDPEFKVTKQSIIDASENDDHQDYRVNLVEFINDSSYDADDEFFYEMLEFVRFYDYENPENLKSSIAYTKPDKRIYMNAPEGGGVGKHTKKWEFIYDHECLHQLWDTFGVAKKIKDEGLEYDHIILNVASDCVINQYLRDMRKKTPFEGGIFPETLEKKFGVDYNYKTDDQFSLYVKLMEHQDEIKKDKDLMKEIEDMGEKLKPKEIRKGPGGGGGGGPKVQHSDDYKRGWTDAIKDVLGKKIDPLTVKPKPVKGDYEQGYNDAIDQIKDGLENGLELSDGPQGGGGGGSDLPDIPWDTPPQKSGGSSGDGEKDNDNKDSSDQDSNDSDGGGGGSSSDSSDDKQGEGKGGSGKPNASSAQDAADEAKTAADHAQDAADKAKADGDSDAAEKQKNATAAKKAAKEAQDAANEAAEAADEGDEESETKAAKKAKDAADKAKEAAAKNGVKVEGGDGKDGEGKDGDDRNEDGVLTGQQSPKGGKGNNRKPSPESPADIAKITAKATKVLEKWGNKVSGDLGEFLNKCRSAKKLNKGGMQIGAEHAQKGWEEKMYQYTTNFVKKNINAHRRQFKKSYRRIDRRSGKLPKFDEFMRPGKEVKKNSLLVNAAFYVDNSGSMDYGDRIGSVWTATYEICEALKKKFSHNNVVSGVGFKIHYFNDYVHEIDYGKKTGTSGCTLPFEDLLEQILLRSNDYLINIIITDAGFNSIDYEDCKKFMSKVSGMVNFITVCDNPTVKKLASEFPNQFFYILAGENFKLSGKKPK